MKTAFNISAVAIFLTVTPGPCFAEWGIETISKERARELGMEVRSTAARRAPAPLRQIAQLLQAAAEARGPTARIRFRPARRRDRIRAFPLPEFPGLDRPRRPPH